MAGSVTMLGKNDQMDGLLGVRVTYTQVGPIGQKAYMGQNIHLHYSYATCLIEEVKLDRSLISTEI